MLPQATKAQYGQYVREWRQRNPHVEELTDEHTAQALKEAGVQPLPDRIVQIKGSGKKDPGQRIRPEDAHLLPFVQDFVRSGKWSDVADLQNAGLYRRNVLSPDEMKAFPDSEYLTMDEIKKMREGKSWTPIDDRPEFAQGGTVSWSNFIKER